MIAKKDSKILLEHILESIGEIEKNFSRRSKKEFLHSTTIQDAVIRRLEIIGEAVKNLPLSFKHKNPNIPWKKIAGLRDVLIHEYVNTLGLIMIWCGRLQTRISQSSKNKF